MSPASVEIRCSACGAEALLRREPLYEGFRKTGEVLRCSACGHVYPDEASVPFKRPSAPRLFGEGDRAKEVRVFSDGEAQRLCRRCAHYVVNPFTQRCERHKRIVEATDSCPQFEPRGEPGAEAGDGRR